jgi:hypothetical protein
MDILGTRITVFEREKLTTALPWRFCPLTSSIILFKLSTVSSTSIEAFTKKNFYKEKTDLLHSSILRMGPLTLEPT